MNLISTLVIILLVLPIHGIITDISSGKIKNYFIFPSLFFCFLLGAFIDGFYSTQSNLIGIGICIAIGFLFYRQHSWGAGDGKYIILLGICSTLITYLKSLPYMIISLLFASIFGIFILYNLYYLIQKLPSIRKISFPKYTIHWLYLMMTTSGIFIVSSGLNLVISNHYTFLIIFLGIIFLQSYTRYIQTSWVQGLIMVVAILLLILTGRGINFGIIGVFVVLFHVLEHYLTPIFDTIDTKKINITELQQGNILTPSAIGYIKKETGLEYSHSSLQGDEVYAIIGHFTKSKKDPSISIYEEIKMGIFMYLGYLIVMLFVILKN